MQRLPFKPSVPNYTFTTTISDDPTAPATYKFDVRWNASDDGWYFDVYEQDGTLIMASVKIVLGTYLGRRSNHPLFRNGVLFPIDTSGDERDPGIDDMGTRVKVIRMTRTELATAAGIT